jgi:sporulation protein YlmC with PRC-barrel domain
MSDQFTAARGRKVVSRASAEELGNVSHMVVDAEQRRIVAVVVGKRRKARLVEWEGFTGFGPDAVMVADESSLREPRDEREQAAASGELELLGRPVLSDLGNLLGEIGDVGFDPETGALETILVGEDNQPATSLVGVGSFAVILHLNETAEG